MGRHEPKNLGADAMKVPCELTTMTLMRTMARLTLAINPTLTPSDCASDTLESCANAT